MTEEKYNGWTNYPTWRVKLELFDNSEGFEEEVTAEQVEEQADEILSGYGEIKEPSLALDYARAFLADVNWREIADSLNEEIRERKAK
jgi:hypothetical protein